MFSRRSARTPFLSLSLITVLTLVAISNVFVTPALAATLPTGFNETVIASGLARPYSMTFAPDGRLFISLQGGRVRIIKNGVLLAANFLDLTGTVDTNGDRGAMGIAFDPDFATNHYMYLYYTVKGVNGAPSHHRVSRFTANGDVAVPGSEFIVFELPPLGSAVLHNGGALNFGTDGKLYVTVGDNTVLTNAQSLSTTLGKVLRINPDGTIPTDNPYYNTATGNNRAIWVTGVRNPFTAQFQPNTNNLFLNDVGATAWEEIDVAHGGENFGWPTTEGMFDPAAYPNFTNPTFTYPHGNTDTSGCAIVGAAFYRPAPQVQQFPSQYYGDYFFADHCQGWIRVLDVATNQVSPFATGISSPIDLEVGPDGSLYYIKRDLSLPTSSDGFIIKINYTGVPSISSQPSDVTVTVGQPASFSVTASGDPPLTYQWQRDGVDIPDATASTYSLPSTALSDSGAKFQVVVSNGMGSVTSNAATLTVTTDQPPTATIITPAEGALYTAGQVVSFSGSATDPEDGTLPASAFTWEIVFHHNVHTHYFINPIVGVKSGSFTIPNVGETDSDVWYRIHLTVKDSTGITYTTYRDIHPKTSTIKLATEPAGLKVALDGTELTTPFSTVSVVGMKRTLGPVSPQTVNGVTWAFDSWSDRAKATHTIATSSSNKTYVATYHVDGGSVGTGTGLAATYFDNMDLTNPIKSQLDQTVNFNWGTAAPISGVGADTFSVRWTGQVQAQFSETYTLYTQSNDGVRLWVNGQLLINNWTNHALTENSVLVNFVAGTRYDIKLEFYDNTGSARIGLLWSSPSTPKSVVPRSQLYQPAASVLQMAAPESEVVK